MTQFVYDGSYGGLLTAIFEIYERRCLQVNVVCSSRAEAMVLTENIEVHTDPQKAARVLKGLSKKLSPDTVVNIYRCYLSELKGIENTIVDFARYVFSSKINVEDNYGHAAVLAISQTAHKVGREKHRFEAFVRFESIDSSLFFATVEPDFNVLPLIMPHFKRRYADQSWIIYDAKRKYGIHYDRDTEEVSEVTMNFVSHASQEPAPAGLTFDAEQPMYEALWKTYFKSSNIVSRKNMKLQLQHLPRRYWKYLVEKQ